MISDFEKELFKSIAEQIESEMVPHDETVSEFERKTKVLLFLIFKEIDCDYFVESWFSVSLIKTIFFTARGLFSTMLQFKILNPRPNTIILILILFSMKSTSHWSN